MSLSKSAVDKIGYALRSGQFDSVALIQLDSYRRSFSDAYDDVVYTLRDKLSLSVVGRPAKSTIAIIEKLKRETIRLSQVQDIAGCRVIVGGLVEQDLVLDSIKVMLGILDSQVDDKRRSPTNGYRAIHIIAEKQGLPVEIQLRTKFQDVWAQISEKLADMYGQEIKYGMGNPQVLAVLSRLAELSHQLDMLASEIAHRRVRLDSGLTLSRAEFKSLKRDVGQLSDRRRNVFRELQVLLHKPLPVPS